MLVARKSFLLALLMTALLQLAAGDASAKWSPARAHFDQSFGSGGTLPLKVPRGLSITITDDRSDAAAGPRGSFFAVYSLESDKTSGQRGGMVVKVARNGQPDPTFGRNGYARIKGHTGPNRVWSFRDGSILVLSAASRHGGGTEKWLLHRRNRQGRFDRSFGKHGYVHFVTYDPGNTIIPVVGTLDHGRFGIVLKDSSKYPGDRLNVFNRHGHLDKNFAHGQRDLPFEIDSIAPAERGRILVAGVGDELSVAKLRHSGDVVPTWGRDGIATLDRLPRMLWNPRNSKKVKYPSDFALGDVKAIAIGRSVLFTASSYDGDSDYSSENGWAGRFTSRGRFDTKWGSGGVRNLTGAENSSEGDGSGSGVDYNPMPDGRIFNASFYSDDWGDYNESVLGSVGRSGTPHARGSRRMSYNGFSYYGTATSWSGKYLFIYGYRSTGGLIAKRVRI